jgi:Regulator of ribonuclease activity B
MPQNVETLLASQLAMNRTTWSTLVEQGVDETTMLILDFAFNSPGRREAEALVEFVTKSTDYDVLAEALGVNAPAQQDWVVTGQTQPTTLSLDVIDQWVRWMVAAGSANSCDFDGWGAFVP